MKKNALFAILILAGATITFSGCKDDPVEPSTPAEKNVSLDVQHTVDGGALALNSNYDINGQTVQFTNIKYFLSDVTFTDDDGESIVQSTDGNGVILVTADGASAVIGVTTAESIPNVRFAFGVDSLRNHADPMLADAPLDLSGAADDMHWSWAAGYKFMRLEGMVEVDGQMEMFQYHIGFDDYYAEIPEVNIDRTLTGDVTITATMDVMGLLSGLTAGGIESGMFHGPEHPLEVLAVLNITAGNAFSID